MAKVIIIEDNLEYQQFLVENLKQAGHTILFSGTSPIEVLMNYKQYYNCELLITDYFMPTMNGIDFIIYFKRVLPESAIILLTALEEEDIELQALEVDVDYFLNKKMSVEKLNKYVEKALKH